MFRKAEEKKQNDINIRNGTDAEELRGSIGNEANLGNDLLNNISNEANNEQILEGMKENEPNDSGIGGRISKEDGLDLLKGLELIPEEEKDQAGLADGRDAIQNAAQGGSIDNLDWIPDEDPDDEEDLATNKAHRRKKKTVPTKNKKSKKTEKKKSPNDAEDLGVAAEDMEPIKGWNFEPERFPERQRQSGAGKLATKIAYYTGKSVGKALSFLLKLAVFPYGAYLLGKRFYNWWNNRSGLQKKRDFKTIPGWNGAKFENGPKDPDELDIDFRRVPEIWSYPIAAEAEKEPGKPRDPILSVYIAQVRPGEYTQTDDEGSTGHSGIGIEFSRYSKIHQKWERYNLRYGFFLSGGMTSLATEVMLGYHQATVPGQLMSEKGREYDISRSYPVKNRQVNAVLKASKTYADKGYNNYTRNCTTFAREMIVNYARIPGTAPLFKQDEVEFSKKHDRQLFGASLITTENKNSLGSDMTKLTHGNDYNYTGFGNKRATKEEYDRYKKSLSYFKGVPGKADLPSVVAENLRRDTRWKTGGTVGVMTKSTNTMDDAKEKMPGLGAKLLEKIRSITPQEQLEGDIPEELRGILDLLEHMDRPLEDIEAKLYTEDELRQIRTKMSDLIGKMNLLLYKYFKNDHRIHFDVMKIIELAAGAMDDADYRYRLYMEDNEIGGGDLGTLRNDMMNKKQKFSMRNGSESVEMTPSQLEGWMQIYKSTDEAIRKAARFKSLERNGRASAEEIKEYQRLTRMNELANDFSRSHRYMLEKEHFSRQDMDYAFALEKRERNGLTDESLAGGKTSGAVYQSLILEEVFNGMKERVSSFMTKNHIEENKDDAALAEWLDDDMAKCIKDKADVMSRIAGALRKSLSPADEPGLSREDLLEELLDLIRKRWISRLFTGAAQENKNELLIDTSERNSREDLLRGAYDRVAEGGKMTRQLDACVLRELSQKDDVQ